MALVAERTGSMSANGGELSDAEAREAADELGIARRRREDDDDDVTAAEAKAAAAQVGVAGADQPAVMRSPEQIQRDAADGAATQQAAMDEAVRRQQAEVTEAQARETAAELGIDTGEAEATAEQRRQAARDLGIDTSEPAGEVETVARDTSTQPSPQERRRARQAAQEVGVIERERPPRQGVETGGDGRVTQVATVLEQDVLTANPDLIPQDVRITRDGDTLRAELTRTGQRIFREERAADLRSRQQRQPVDVTGILDALEQRGEDLAQVRAQQGFDVAEAIGTVERRAEAREGEVGQTIDQQAAEFNRNLAGQRRQQEPPERFRDEFEDPVTGVTLFGGTQAGEGRFVPFSAIPGVQEGTTFEDLTAEGESALQNFGQQVGAAAVQGAVPNPAFPSSVQGPSAVEAAIERPEPETPFERQAQALIAGGTGDLLSIPFGVAGSLEEVREFGIEAERVRQEEGLGVELIPGTARAAAEPAVPGAGVDATAIPGGPGPGRPVATEPAQASIPPIPGLGVEGGVIGFTAEEAEETGQVIVEGLERQVESPTGRAQLAGSLVGSVALFGAASAVGPRTSLATRAAIQPGEEALGFGGFGVTRRLFGRGAAESLFPQQEPLIFSEEAAIRRARQAGSAVAGVPAGVRGVFGFEPSPRQIRTVETLRAGGPTGEIEAQDVFDPTTGEIVAEERAGQATGIPGASEPLGAPTEGILDITEPAQAGAVDVRGPLQGPAAETVAEPGAAGREGPPPLFGEIQEAGGARRFARGEEPAQGPAIFPEDVGLETFTERGRELFTGEDRGQVTLGLPTRAETTGSEPAFEEFTDFSQFEEGRITPDFLSEQRSLFGEFAVEQGFGRPIEAEVERQGQAQRPGVERGQEAMRPRTDIEGIFGLQEGALGVGTEPFGGLAFEQNLIPGTRGELLPGVEQRQRIDVEARQDLRQEFRLQQRQDLEGETEPEFETVFEPFFEPRGEVEREVEFETEAEFERELEAERLASQGEEEEEQLAALFGAPVGARFQNPFMTAGEALQLGFAGFGGGLFGEAADAPGTGASRSASSDDVIPNPFE